MVHTLLLSPDGSEYAVFPEAPLQVGQDGNFEVPLYAVSALTAQARLVTRLRIVYLQGFRWTDDGWIHFIATTATEPQKRLCR